MNILLTNDDGVFAEGISCLAKALKKEHNLLIVAPDTQRSGAAHSFTMYVPLRCKRVELKGLEDVPAYAVSGTPVDCVKLAYGNFDFDIDLVISGINDGENRGTDVFYSGTVSAAVEAVLLGIPAIAASNISSNCKYGDDTAEVIRQIVGKLIETGISKNMLLNINVPDLPISSLKGMKITKLSAQTYENIFDERIDMRGGKYYWLPSGKTTVCGEHDDNDERWANEGYATITPLVPDLTDYKSMGYYKDILGDSLK